MQASLTTVQLSPVSERFISGVTGEINEVEDLMSSVLDVQKDLKSIKNAERNYKE